MSLRVELLTYTQDCEKIVASAAKLCYSPSGVGDIMDKMSNEKTEDFLDMLMSMGHQSPIEHASFTFGIEGVSRVLTHQLVRHRIASYSQQSQRYVREKNFDYIIPPAIGENVEAKEKYIAAMEHAQNSYNELCDVLKERNYEILIAEGKSEKTAKMQAGKLANEDARFVLPNACETKIVVTMNTRSLINFFHHRCCTRAQWEIRDMANEMLKLVRGVAPTLFKLAGPPCVCQACPEGIKSCGEKAAMEKMYLGRGKQNG